MHSESISEAEFLELCCYYVVMSVCSHCYHNDISNGGSGEGAGVAPSPYLILGFKKIAEGRKAGRARKKRAPISSASESTTDNRPSVAMLVSLCR